MIDQLIFDRTDPQGGWGIDDIERISDAVDYLETELSRLGFGNFPDFSSFQEGEPVTSEKLDIIRDSIDYIKTRLKVTEDTPDTPPTLSFLDVPKANALEKILFDVEQRRIATASTVDTAWTTGTAWTGLYASTTVQEPVYLLTEDGNEIVDESGNPFDVRYLPTIDSGTIAFIISNGTDTFRGEDITIASQN